MSQVKERPILFSGPMVQALLNGTKTQTRRIIKNEIQHVPDGVHNAKWYFRRNDDVLNSFETAEQLAAHHCPYGKPGERLWVRESCAFLGERLLKSEGVAGYLYRADSNEFDGVGIKWKPSIHMPRKASRILLEIVSVRVERLQSISPEDAQAEGIVHNWGGWKNYIKPELRYTRPEYEVLGEKIAAPVMSFSSLWISINGEESFEANPWVWVVEFKRITP